MVKLWHFCVFFDLQNVHLTVNLKAASSRTTGNHGSLPEIKLDIWLDTPKPLSDFVRFFPKKKRVEYKMVLQNGTRSLRKPSFSVKLRLFEDAVLSFESTLNTIAFWPLGSMAESGKRDLFSNSLFLNVRLIRDSIFKRQDTFNVNHKLLWIERVRGRTVIQFTLGSASDI